MDRVILQDDRKRDQRQRIGCSGKLLVRHEKLFLSA
jgi:hypothetical protein